LDRRDTGAEMRWQESTEDLEGLRANVSG